MTEAAERREARHRLERVLYLALGLGAIVFGAILATGDGGFLAQVPQLRSPFGWIAVGVAILVPATFTVLAYTLRPNAMRALAGTTALAFIAIQLLFVPMLTDTYLDGNAAPFLQGVTAMHATLAAVVWQRPAVWLYAIAQGPIVALTQIEVRQNSVLDAVLDGLGAMLFSLILMGVALAVVSAADRQDRAALRAREQASLEAGRRTREREQSRINAIVHDDIMSVLLAAGRENPPTQLADQARAALHAIETLEQGSPESRPYRPEEAIAVLRSSVAEASPDAEFTYDLDGDATMDASLDATVVAALSEALTEAVRNSVLHAHRSDGPVRRRVHASVGPGFAKVRATDDGQGFSPRSVPQRRLGIRVSILDRMAVLPGGAGDVESRPGQGTAVSLTWTRP